MYGESETDLSRRHLHMIFENVEEGCLLGGWAVFLNVNENFKRTTGHSYIGSRDIDIGFKLKPVSRAKALLRTEFARVFQKLKDAGFRGQSFRMFKDFDRDTGRELSPEESNEKPFYEVLRLYIDLVVNQIPEFFRETFGFTPIDEPLLTQAYDDKHIIDIMWEGTPLRTVDSTVLLCMKLRSMVNRTRDYKRIKDIADVYALIWHSEKSIDIVKRDVAVILEPEVIRDMLGSIKADEVEEVSNFLDIEPEQITRVIREFRRI